MRKRTLGVVLVAGLAMSGAGAFTASNTVSAIDGANKNIAGYGQATVTGATVTSINYTTVATDATKLASVKFQSSDDLTAKKGYLTLRDAVGQMGNPYTCSVTYYPVSATSTPPVTVAYSEAICATADNPVIASIVGTGITVSN